MLHKNITLIYLNLNKENKLHNYKQYIFANIFKTKKKKKKKIDETL